MDELERRSMVTTLKINRIADAIREKLGNGTLYTLDEMPDAIRSIGGGIPTGLAEGFVCNFGIIPGAVKGVLYE